MSREYRVNHQIEAKEVNLVLPDGSMKGIVLLSDALLVAEDEGLDLVEVSIARKGQPSVCKIIDYGKMMYQQSKRKKMNKQVQHTKEIKYSFNISDHDLGVKHRKVLEFLSKHYVVRYVLELRGREKHMAQEALGKMKSNLIEFEKIATWKEPRVSGGTKRTEISTVLHTK